MKIDTGQFRKWRVEWDEQLTKRKFLDALSGEQFKIQGLTYRHSLDDIADLFYFKRRISEKVLRKRLPQEFKQRVQAARYMPDSLCSIRKAISKDGPYLIKNLVRDTIEDQIIEAIQEGKKINQLYFDQHMDKAFVKVLAKKLCLFERIEKLEEGKRKQNLFKLEDGQISDKQPMSPFKNYSRKSKRIAVNIDHFKNQQVAQILVQIKREEEDSR